jgi:hypothetical protein
MMLVGSYLSRLYRRALLARKDCTMEKRSDHDRYRYYVPAALRLKRRETRAVEQAAREAKRTQQLALPGMTADEAAKQMVQRAEARAQELREARAKPVAKKPMSAAKAAQLSAARQTRSAKAAQRRLESAHLVPKNLLPIEGPKKGQKWTLDTPHATIVIIAKG